MENEVMYSLKELRARKDMTQAEIARELGISLTTYNAWEKDVSGVAAGKVRDLARYHGVKMDQIFFTPQHESNSINVRDPA